MPMAKNAHETGARFPLFFGVRIALWYATLFVAGSIAIVLLTYYLTAASLAQRDQQIIRGTLANIQRRVRAAKLTRTALILVGRVLGNEAFRDSALYDPAHVHVLRPERRG